MVKVVDRGPGREKEESQIQLLEKITRESKLFERPLFHKRGIENDQAFFKIYMLANNKKSRMVASVFPSNSTLKLYAPEVFDGFRKLVESYQKKLAAPWAIIQDYKHPDFGTTL